MVLNNKGQVIFYTFMLGIVVIILALALSTPIKQTVDTTRSDSTPESVGLNCTSTTDTYVKAQCIFTDLATSYFLFGLLAIAGMIITAKVVFG